MLFEGGRPAWRFALAFENQCPGINVRLNSVTERQCQLPDESFVYPLKRRIGYGG
jgi:hypothetical protein